ncbi:MAG: biotin--[acetyl-CoA-carboxylase] ligase [Hyphomicrobiaceae bacterium]|nr:biotin--[acetyl-CoA-carboxylase] ligase [Hyphomicrobiaceae bacterium]
MAGAASQELDALWIELDEVDSTNAEAMRRAQAGSPGPLYISANRQTAGRGRSGRPWQSSAGNLALSRLLTLDCPPMCVAQLSLAAGVAVHEAACSALGEQDVAHPLYLKWPNDILANGAKLAGILVEATSVGPQRIAIIGIGVNVLEAPGVSDRATVSLGDIAPGIESPRAFARRVAERLEALLALWDQGRGFDAIRERWIAAALPIGTAISVNTGREVATGTFAGLDPSGCLLLEDGGERKVFTFGDVALIPD